MLNRSHKPLIGVTLDRETDSTYSKFPWYAIRENYMQAVAAAADHGALVVPRDRARPELREAHGQEEEVGVLRLAHHL